MSQSLNTVPAFDGKNYGYWKARMRFFLKSFDCWSIVETGWTKPADATLELVTEKNARLSNDRVLHALCQALSTSEFARISNSESAKDERPKKPNGESWENVKLIRKILRSFPERFRIKVTTIEESKDLEEMKIEELVGSLQTYELSLPPVKKLKTIALKAPKKKVEVSFGDDSEDEEKVVAMLAKIFGRLMRNERFKNKFSKKMKKVPREAEKKDPRGQRCYECSGFGHIRADCGNLKQGKRKAYNVTLSDEFEE